jgi:hypothetical protein
MHLLPRKRMLWKQSWRRNQVWTVHILGQAARNLEICPHLIKQVWVGPETGDLQATLV